MPSRAKIYLAGLIVGSILTAIYDAITYYHDLEPSSVVAMLWPTAFVFLLILWVVEDSKGRPDTYRPFEFGFLAFMFWIPYFPYYLWHTRGTKGLLLLMAFAALFLLGSLAQWVIYAAS